MTNACLAHKHRNIHTERAEGTAGGEARSGDRREPTSRRHNKSPVISNGALLSFQVCLILFMSIEAGASTGGVVAMAANVFDGRERPNEKADQHGHRAALFSCSSVGGLTIFVQTTDIHNADAVGVVSFAVCSHLVERSAHLQGAIEPYYVVVPDAIEASLSMPLVYIGC